MKKFEQHIVFRHEDESIEKFVERVTETACYFNTINISYPNENIAIILYMKGNK